MADTPASGVVVTFSPQSSVAYFLKGVLDCAGLAVEAAASTPEDLEAIVGRARPYAIVYDVSFPFTANWQKLQELRSRPALRSIPVIVTTSEARELFRTTGCSSAIEIFSRPDDVAALREALRGAIEAVAPGCAA
jgi:CheY-like chemotaxis protein